MERLEKSREKLAAAEYLLNGEFYEDSISRSYYAMYHAAKAVMNEEDVSAKTHTGLIRMVGRELVKTGRLEKKLGRAFSMVEEDRETADYDIQIDFSKEQAEENLKTARNFVEEMENILNT